MKAFLRLHTGNDGRRRDGELLNDRIRGTVQSVARLSGLYFNRTGPGQGNRVS